MVTIDEQKKAAYGKLEQLRWGLVERKYTIGLNQDEHDRLEYISGWCWNYGKKRGIK